MAVRGSACDTRRPANFLTQDKVWNERGQMEGGPFGASENATGGPNPLSWTLAAARFVFWLLAVLVPRSKASGESTVPRPRLDDRNRRLPGSHGPVAGDFQPAPPIGEIVFEVGALHAKLMRR